MLFRPRAATFHKAGLAGRALWLALWAAVTPCLAQAPATTACSSCHDAGQKMEKRAHAPLACLACHPQHETYPHPEGIAKPGCAGCHKQVAGEQARGVHGQQLLKGNAGAPDCAVCHGSTHEVQKTKSVEFRATLPETCGMCHTEVAEQFRGSVHGRASERGLPQAPICTDCHGEHSILAHTSASSPVNVRHIRETCGSCHGDVRLSRKFGLPADRIISFDASFHGMAAKAGSQTVANCASCHGVHNILPSSDPRSTVHARNLPATCGHCHPGAGQRFAIGRVHFTEARSEPAGVRWVRQLYQWVIPLIIGLMLLHNAGDWVRKLCRLRLRLPVQRLDQLAGRVGSSFRMYLSERVVHGLLAISFAVLVWSGFALKYPDQWWARPVLLWEPAQPVRSLIHRIAAVVFIAVSAAHLVSLCASSKLRHHWQALLPSRRDFSEGFSFLAYNLGVRSKPPVRSEHCYVEKAEYWAVAWGAVVMILTGGLLWAHTLVLAWMPKSVLDVATAIHFYEAVLATLAIVVWHFYFVIFDPEVYPMDPAWLTGFSVRRRASPDAVARESVPAESAITEEAQTTGP